MNEQPIRIALDSLHTHPKNPRIEPRQDVVDQIAAQITAGFDASHALIVRPNAAGYEIISGHHRWLAAQQAGLAEVPCWVRDYSDADAYMQLVLCNTQSELHPLEEGKHAAESGLSGSEYARMIGQPQSNVALRIKAARVFSASTCVLKDVRDSWRNLAEIHAAPRWLWSALVEAMVADGWTVAKTRERTAALKGLEIPEPFGVAAIADHLAACRMQPGELKQMRDAFTKANVRDDDLDNAFTEAVTKTAPSRLSEVQQLALEWERKQQERDQAAKQADLEKQRANEQAEQRITRLRANCSLDEWKDLGPEERESLLVPAHGSGGTFNAQENEAIEWAQWSWNPVTGCRHDCPYCYARDIAQSARMAKVYPNGFAPTFRSNALNGPANTKVPPDAKRDTRHRNVFTCSMADLFGRWVPAEWIDAVMSTVRDSPEWNFLFLTKFPNRLAEIDIPDNAWVGTTVDVQARVANAEKSFQRVGGRVKWLSVEPMLEPLQFSRLDLFDWIVIGGASSSSKTPAWRPPFAWIHDFVDQARAAGCKIYMKTNLFGDQKDGRGPYTANARLLELPFDAPITGDPLRAPEVFNYLGKGNP